MAESQLVKSQCPCQGGSSWEFIGGFYAKVYQADSRALQAEQATAEATTQMTALEGEVQRLQKSLNSAREHADGLRQELDEARTDMGEQAEELSYEKAKASGLEKELHDEQVQKCRIQDELQDTSTALSACGSLVDDLQLEVVRLSQTTVIGPTLPTAGLMLELEMARRKIRYMEQSRTATDPQAVSEDKLGRCLDEVHTLRTTAALDKQTMQDQAREMCALQQELNELKTMAGVEQAVSSRTPRAREKIRREEHGRGLALLEQRSGRFNMLADRVPRDGRVMAPPSN